MIIALAGGVGGARLAHGLARALPPGELTVVVNTGDDFTHLGLNICPDPDTVMYTLAGLADPERGWGVEGETFNAMEALGQLGGENWFSLGDRDLATHIERTRRLALGEPLSTIMADFCARLGIQHGVIPMSDDPIRTIVHTAEGDLPFQDYFVRHRCAPAIARLSFKGAGDASPSPALNDLMQSDRVRGVVICPSNPFLSIDPILAVPGVRPWLQGRKFPCIAISPLIGGKAVKGPAAKIMAELQLDAKPRAIALHYQGLIDGLVIDQEDSANAFGQCLVTSTLMRNMADRERLAREALSYLESLRIV